MNVSLTFLIDPVPASRPRVSRAGWSYYAEPYRSFKDDLGELVAEAWKGKEPLTCQLRARIEVFKEQPGSTKLDAPKPDADNYAKAVLDAMNKIVFHDDSQVETLVVHKRWAKKGAHGCIKVRLVPVVRKAKKPALKK
jgi:Holliday junction resolvase RusA-like endonuclease